MMLLFVSSIVPGVSSVGAKWALQPLRQRCTTRLSGVRSRRVRACAGSQPAVSEAAEDLRYEDDGSRVVPVEIFIRGTSAEKVTGVYAVMDEARQTTFVSLSRDVSKSLEALLENEDEELVEFVKVMTFAVPSVRDMKKVVQTWIKENESMPIGNEEQWEEADAEFAKQASLIQVEEEPDVISPFENEQVELQVAEQLMELSVENVDAVLDEVRPYLIADGGNVSIVSVDTESKGVVLQLQGACGSCSSATTTMQMGIEKALRAKFGDNIGEVTAMSSEEGGGISKEACEQALSEVGPALRGLGASVEITQVDEDEGEVRVSFTGPDNLKYGVELLLKDKVAGVETVTFT